MSESLLHVSVPEEINYLAQLSGFACAEFRHLVINTSQQFTGPAPAAGYIVNYTVPENMALIVTGVDCKALFDINDATFNGDFRATDDINPYGPYFAGSDLGQFSIFDNGQLYGAVAFDIGVINGGIILVIDSLHVFQVAVDPFLPAGKHVTLLSRFNCYLVRSVVAQEVKKNQTQIITQVL